MVDIKSLAARILQMDELQEDDYFEIYSALEVIKSVADAGQKNIKGIILKKAKEGSIEPTFKYTEAADRIILDTPYIKDTFSQKDYPEIYKDSRVSEFVAPNFSKEFSKELKAITYDL